MEEIQLYKITNTKPPPELIEKFHRERKFMVDAKNIRDRICMKLNLDYSLKCEQYFGNKNISNLYLI